jgi:hypothetical protein
MKFIQISLLAVAAGCQSNSNVGESQEMRSSGSNEKAMIVCESTSLKEPGHVIEEQAKLVRIIEGAGGEKFRLTYKFNVKNNGLSVKSGEQVLSGRLDPEFNHVFSKETIYFLLESAQMASNYKVNEVLKSEKSELGKTEFLLKDNNRLIIEEKDIVLDLKGCKKV